ncbi:MAG: HAD family hydrolase, partial [Olsenella sp.]
YFEVFVLSSRAGKAKPQPTMYQEAILEAHTQPERALFVDDSPVNCTGAIRLGMLSVLLCRQTSLRMLERIAHPRIRVISNLHQLTCQS